MDCEACGGLFGLIGQSNGLPEVRQRALAQEIRMWRRESSITFLEHPEVGEKQSNHLLEGSVNIVNGLFRTLKSST